MEKSNGRKNRKSEIIQTVYNLIGREGLEKATTKRIAKEINATPSLIFHYFDSKEEMLYDVIDFMLTKTEGIYKDKLKEISDPKERLMWFLEKSYNLDVAQSVDDKVFYAFYWLSFENKEILYRFKQLYDRDQRIAKQLIDDYIYKYDIPDLDSRLLCMEYLSHREGLNLLHAVYGGTQQFSDCMESMKNKVFKELKLV